MTSRSLYSEIHFRYWEFYTRRRKCYTRCSLRRLRAHIPPSPNPPLLLYPLSLLAPHFPLYYSVLSSLFMSLPVCFPPADWDIVQHFDMAPFHLQYQPCSRTVTDSESEVLPSLFIMLLSISFIISLFIHTARHMVISLVGFYIQINVEFLIKMPVLQSFGT